MRVLFISIVMTAVINVRAQDTAAPPRESTNASGRAVLKDIKVDETGFVVDGKPFFVRGISYSPFYPGESNRDASRKAPIADDLKRIRGIDANTLLIYWLRSEEIYRQARENGLMILQGIWIDQNPPDFQDPHFKDGVRRQIRHAIDYIHNLNGVDYSDVVLGLWIGGEFDLASINGTDDRHKDINKFEGKYYKTPKSATATECFLAEMCDYGRTYANDKYGHDFLFSHINWPTADQWLRLGFLDYILFDVYSYWPPNVASARPGSFAPTSYQGYLESLKKLYPRKPLIISEFGYSTAPDNATETGNNERDQAAGLVARWHDIVTTETPLAGGCVFEWNDEWWKQSGAAALVPHSTDLNYHERDDGEEWFGLIAIDGESKAKYTVRPRPALHAVQRMFSPNFTEERRSLKPVLIDTFRRAENLQGGKWETLPELKEGFTAQRIADDNVRSSLSLKLTLDRAKQELGDRVLEYRSLLLKDGKPLDVSNQLHLGFYVRGDVDQGSFKVKLESETNYLDASQTSGMSDLIVRYLSKRKRKDAEKEWQRISIPLEHFGPLDLSKIKSIALVFDDPSVRKSNLEIKDLEFSPNY